MASENIIGKFDQPINWNTTSGNKAGNTEKVTKEEENIIKKPISEIIDKFCKGNMTINGLITWCNGNHCEVSKATKSSTAYSITFKFQGKNYTVKVNTAMAESSTDNKQNKAYTLAELSKKFNSEDIATYFIKVPNTGTEEQQYVLGTSYQTKFKDINELANYLSTRNDLVLHNYVNNTSALTSSALQKIYTQNSKGKVKTTSLNTTNYAQQADKVDEITKNDNTNTKKVALEKFINDFKAGKIEYKAVDTILDALGVANEKHVLENGKATIKFEFEGKAYSLTTKSTSIQDKLNTDSASYKAYADEKLQIAVDKFKERPGYGERVKEKVQSAYNDCVNLKISKSEFNSKLNTIVKNLKTEIKLIDTAASIIKTYTDKLAKYADAGKELEKNLSTAVEKYYKDGNKTELKTQVKNTYSTVLKKYKALEAEAKVDKYSSGLEGLLDGVTRFEEKADTYITQYSNGKITMSKLESLLNKLSSSVSNAIKKEQEERAKHVEKIEGQYSKVIDLTPNAIFDTFTNIFSAIANSFLGGKISQTDFDKTVKIEFKSLEETAKKSSEGYTVKNADGTKTITKNHDNKTQTVEKYDKNGNLSTRVLYDKNGKVTEECKVTYSNGKISKKVTNVYNNDGTRTEFTYNPKNGVVTRKDFNEKGKNITKNAYNELDTGKVSKSILGIKTITRTSKQMYNYITQDLDKTFASKKILFWNVKVTVRQAIENIAGKHTVALLEAAQVGKGKPAGASKEYKSLAETGCENFIRQTLENTVKKNYGYDPEDVKGYQFGVSSSLSKTMASSSELKALISNTKTLKQLANGQGLPMSLNFKSNADLKFSISSCNIIGSKLSGNKLTLAIYDTYDGNPKSLDNLKSNSSNSEVLNAALEAGFETGKLKPYYFITQVQFTLTAAQLKSIGK